MEAYVNCRREDDVVTILSAKQRGLIFNPDVFTVSELAWKESTGADPVSRRVFGHLSVVFAALSTSFGSTMKFEIEMLNSMGCAISFESEKPKLR